MLAMNIVVVGEETNLRPKQLLRGQALRESSVSSGIGTCCANETVGVEIAIGGVGPQNCPKTMNAFFCFGCDKQI